MEKAVVSENNNICPLVLTPPSNKLPPCSSIAPAKLSSVGVQSVTSSKSDQATLIGALAEPSCAP